MYIQTDSMQLYMKSLVPKFAKIMFFYSILINISQTAVVNKNMIFETISSYGNHAHKVILASFSSQCVRRLL